MVIAPAGFVDEHIHEPGTSASAARFAGNSHRGETAGMQHLPPRDQRDAAGLLVYQQDAAGSQIDAILIDQIQKCNGTELDGDEIGLEAAIQKFNEISQGVVRSGYAGKVHGICSSRSGLQNSIGYTDKRN